jgi:RNA polymerase sigma-70 factor (ECF subfamily)
VLLSRDATVDWVALNILPHEGVVRAWLMRVTRRSAEVDDIIQEAYCQIAELDTVGHIRNGKAYFLATARSIMLQRLRRERVIRIETVTDIEALRLADNEPSPEQVTGDRRELERVLSLIATLPPVCRQVIELRRIHGFSQKETARRLGVSESIVENNMVRGLRVVLKALAEDAGEAAPEPAALRRKESAHV